MGKTAFIYMRASTARQDKSVTQQRKACTEYAAKNKIKVLGEFKDDGISAYKDVERPGFTSLIETCKTRTPDYVLLWNINRFSRQYNQGMIELLSLDMAGVKVMDCTGDVFDSDDIGGAIKQVLGLFGAQKFSKDLGEATKRGQQHSRSLGYPHGVASMGYMRVEDGVSTRWVPDDEHPEERVIVIQFFKWFDKGESFNGICKLANGMGMPTKRGNQWSPIGVRKLLSNESYGGYQCGERRKYIQTFVPKALWKRVNARILKMDAKGTTRRGQTRKNPLTGLIYCSCGDLAHSKGGTGRRRYTCRGRTKGTCDIQQTVKGNVLEDMIMQLWRDMLESEGIDYWAKVAVKKEYKIAKESAKSVQHIIDRIDELDAAEERLMDLAISGTNMNALNRKMAKIVSERDRLRAEIDTDNGEMKMLPISEAVEAVKRVMMGFDNIRALAEHIDKITITGQNQVEVKMLGSVHSLIVR